MKQPSHLIDNGKKIVFRDDIDYLRYDTIINTKPPTLFFDNDPELEIFVERFRKIHDAVIMDMGTMDMIDDYLARDFYVFIPQNKVSGYLIWRIPQGMRTNTDKLIQYSIRKK